MQTGRRRTAGSRELGTVGRNRFLAPFYFFLRASIAARTFGGDIGSSVSRVPTARSIALAIAAIGGQMLASAVAGLLGDQGPNGFDRHEHHAFAERGTNEAVAFVEFGSRFVDGVGDDTSHPGNFGCREASPQRVCQQR